MSVLGEQGRGDGSAHTGREGVRTRRCCFSCVREVILDRQTGLLAILDLGSHRFRCVGVPTVRLEGNHNYSHVTIEKCAWLVARLDCGEWLAAGTSWWRPGHHIFIYEHLVT